MTDKHIAQRAAYSIIRGFDKSFRWFSRVTGEAHSLFEQGDWQTMQNSVKKRIHIYEKSLSDAVAELYAVEPAMRADDNFWYALKTAYQGQLNGHPQFELAETYYNSVIGRVFKHKRIDDNMLFLQPSRCFIAGVDRDKIIHQFDTKTTVRELYESLFSVYRFSIPFEDKERDMERLESALRERLSKEQLASVTDVEVLRSVFFRGKAAYIIGRMCMPEQTLPFVVSLQTNEQQEIYVDALLTERRDLSVVFGFARAYFMVDVQYPAEMVSFLHELIPNKKRFELYISLGFHKHGKTEFYRDFLTHLDKSDDQFEVAPGIKGLVMAVFHLPSYGVVFKLIKDKFGDSKRITRDHVKFCYDLVKTSDRVGRMADTHEYVNFQLPKHRVSQALIDELQETCASSIEVKEDTVVIKHVYIEKRLTPLNLYLAAETDEDKVDQAIKDLGLCIKQISLANIFPGDMLHKNFGITKHGRVVFYDYDEICWMNERQFRALPKDDPYGMDTLSVGPTDVFPEQFEHFILSKPAWKKRLKHHHADLFTPEYWWNVQQGIEDGTNPHFCPYNPTMQFPRP
jgi:isocitrate dehydrogenase kinase/phosphatase